MTFTVCVLTQTFEKSPNVLAWVQAYKQSWCTDKNHKTVTHWTSKFLFADAENEWWKMEIFGNLFIVLFYFLSVQDRGSYRGLKKTVQSLQGVVLQWSGSFSTFRKDRLLSSFLYVWMFTSRKMLHSIVQAARFVYNWLPYLSLELLDSCVCVWSWSD